MSAKRKDSAHTSNDAEIPELTDKWVQEADLYHGENLVRRGRPKVARPRKLLSIRLPPEVIERWKATGPGWQSRMADVLEKAVH